MREPAEASKWKMFKQLGLINPIEWQRGDSAGNCEKDKEQSNDRV